MGVRPTTLGFVSLLLVCAAGGALAQRAQYAPWPPPYESPPPSEGMPGYPEPPPRSPELAPDYQSEGPPNAAQLGAPPSPQLVTPSQAGSTSVTTAAEAPLHEMNLVGQKIPPVLLAAMADPYAYPLDMDCRVLAQDVDELTVALGPDFDVPPPETPKATESRGLGLKLMNSAADTLLPFHGFIGYLTGANKRDEKVMRALAAGTARRAYLKGIGEARRCPAPAAPRRWPNATASYDEGLRRPAYPTP